jgi:hypothetical protein
MLLNNTTNLQRKMLMFYSFKPVTLTQVWTKHKASHVMDLERDTSEDTL